MSRFNTSFLVVVAMALSLQGQISIDRDSLAVAPARPTTADPITFSIIIPNWDCCTRYYHDSTAVYVSDTMIILSYQYEFPQVCPMIMCLDVDKTLRYNSAPLKPGKYAVYESRQVYCAGPICPAAVMLPVKIGEITVTPASVVSFRQDLAISKRKSVAGITGQLFSVRGELIGQASRNLKTPGVYYSKANSVKNNSVVVR